MNLTEFLLARITEDEAAIRDFPYPPTDVEKYLAQDMSGPRQDSEYLALHIGSGRMLAECEAKRRIVEEHRGSYTCDTCFVEIGWEEALDGYPVDTVTMQMAPCRTLRALAAVHADHPDYNEAWKPLN